MTPITTQQEARRRQLHDAKQLVLVTVNAILTLRALQSRLPKPPHLGFWVHINNALFDQAVISWAKLFGSDDEERQPTHWKNVFSDHDAFRRSMLAELGVTKDQWTAFWHEMKTYRDKAVAHHDKGRHLITTHPVFDLALASAAFYYKAIIAAFASELDMPFEPKTLDVYLKDYLAHAQLVAGDAVPPTLDIAEYVDTAG